MREVQRAVQDAEAEEAAAGRDDSTGGGGGHAALPGRRKAPRY